ncbi:hypothetical protein K1719_011778 [Acacia pycnantha]|nr:hypothetical protein K1719_011778 [Acacia pycnantha]
MVIAEDEWWERKIKENKEYRKYRYKDDVYRLQMDLEEGSGDSEEELQGWEGTAHDARVFRNAIETPTMNFPHPPKGKYYLVDAGYLTPVGYIGPYKQRERTSSSLYRNQLFRLKFGCNKSARMRLKKGTKVEVSCKEEVPFDCWRCAEIMCGNGHYYSIRYDGGNDEAVAARVPRKAIRPCPPVLELTQDWEPGDVVEVCQKNSWSTATMLKVLGENNVLVRSVGYSFDFIVNKIDIRVKQSWQNEEWIVFGKGSSRGKNGKCYKELAPRLSSMFSAQAQKTTTTTQHSSNRDYLNDKKEVGYQNSHLGYSKTLKRKNHPHVGLSAEPPQKLRATDNEHTGGSLNDRKSDDSVSSSVGSCSVTGFGVHIRHLEVATSDAESARHCRTLELGTRRFYYRCSSFSPHIK